MSYDRLSELLAGRASFDVDAAIKLARAFQLSADTIMQMQLRADFAVARVMARYDDIEVIRPSNLQVFPMSGVMRGRLGASEGIASDRSFFFVEDLQPGSDPDDHAGLHALFRGDLLRVYGTDNMVRWTGRVVTDLNDSLHLPYVRAQEWPRWFRERAVAELAIGDEHAAFFERMNRV